MAHIVVYLQRTPHGLHPASAVGLCWARDLASERGASLTAVCPGDAGALDRATLSAAARFGADVVLFCGPHGLDHLQERLNPVHVLVPWTAEGVAAASGLPGGPVMPRFIGSSSPPYASADAVTGIVAGVLPWHRLDVELEAEYEGDVDDVPLPPWIEVEVAHRGSPPVFQLGAEGQIGYVAPGPVDKLVERRLRALGADPATWDDVFSANSGTYVCLVPAAGPVPQDLAGRGPGSRVIMLPGPRCRVDTSWSFVDWVFQGSWPEVIAALITPLRGSPGIDGPRETAQG
jgi:hypothetical protein